MTIRHLRIFAAVYRAENVTHAAEELHLTQPAVTRAVRELEQYYGTRLFERMYRHLSPTEAGRTARAVLQNALEGRGLPLHAVWESVSTEALVQAAAEGLGVAVLPESRVQGAAQAGRVCLRPIAGNALVRHHVAAWHKEKYLTASMQRFLALCRGGQTTTG